MQIMGYVTEEQRGLSKVTIYRSSACGDGCGNACATCKGASQMEVLAENGEFSPRIGERVILESKTGNVLKLAVIVYVVPLVIAVLGYYLGVALSFGDGGSALCALLGLMIGFIPALIVNKKIAKTEKAAHTVVDILRE